MRALKMFDHEYLIRQLELVGIGERAEDARIMLAMEMLAYTLDAQELTESERSIVLQLFSKTGLEQLQDVSGKVQASKRWSEFEIGNTTYGDIVRVKLNAYDTPSGSEHNGLVGKVESVSHGRVGVRYIGRYADQLQIHPRGNLEVLKSV